MWLGRITRDRTIIPPLNHRESTLKTGLIAASLAITLTGIAHAASSDITPGPVMTTMARASAETIVTVTVTPANHQGYIASFRSRAGIPDRLTAVHCDNPKPASAFPCLGQTLIGEDALTVATETDGQARILDLRIARLSRDGETHLMIVPSLDLPVAGLRKEYSVGDETWIVEATVQSIPE